MPAFTVAGGKCYNSIVFDIVHGFLNGLALPCLLILICIGVGWGLRIFGGLLVRRFWRRNLRVALFIVCSAVATFYGGSKGVRQSGRYPRDGMTVRRETDSTPVNVARQTSFRVVDIVLSNDTFAIETAWTNGLFATGTKLDFLVKTNLTDESWMWSGCEIVTEGVTNSVHYVNLNNFATLVQGADDLAYQILSSSLFVRVVPRLPVSSMADSDRDGIPDAYEFHNDTNPWVADYEQAALRVVVDGRTNLQSVVNHCEPYAIVEVVPGTYSGPGWSNITLPPNPILITGRGGMPVFRDAGFTSFLLPSGTTEETMIRDVYLDRSDDGLQVGFWCGGNLPWINRSASATFDNVYVRFSNPRSSCYGWIFYGASTNRSVLSRCTVNANGASRVRGVYAVNPPPLELNHDTFVNFPASSTSNTSVALLLETLHGTGETNENPIGIANTVFDASFTNAEIVARLGPSNLAPIIVQNCILPRAPARGVSIDASASLWITNATLSVWGYPTSGSPADIAGVGALAVLDPTSLQDSDGDGLTDWQEAYQYQTSPIAWDSDGDGICDGDEIADETDPNDESNFAFNLSVCITNDMPNVAELRFSVFNGATSTVPMVTANIPTNFTSNIRLNHLLVSSNSTSVVRIWYDTNANGAIDVDEWSKTLAYTLKSHHVSTSLQLSEFVDSGEGIPGYWWTENGVINGTDRVATADPDGDGLINLHEFWAGTQPMQPDGTNTLLSVLSRSVDRRLNGRSPTNSLDVYVDYATNGCSTNFVLNPASWLHGVDLSCCSMWTATNGCAFGPTTTPVTVISPRHVIYAHHFNYIDNDTRLETMPIGKSYFFRGRSGVIHERRLIGKCGVAGDIAIGLLDSRLPTNDVTVAKILPRNFGEYLAEGRGIPILVVDQCEKAYVGSSSVVPRDTAYLYLNWLPIKNRYAFRKPGGAIGGDSSSPKFMLLEDDLILVGVTHKSGGFGGAFLTCYKERVQDVMDQLLPGGGYRLQEVDLTPYGKVLEEFR